MRYCLKENLALRGWEDEPFAVQDLNTGWAFFVGEEVFRVLSLCNGVMDMDSFLIPDGFRQIARLFAERKVVEPCEAGSALSPVQKYRAFPCHYIARAHWSITGKCNMSCRHCYVSAPQAKFGEMSHDKCMDIINQLGEIGVPVVNLTGGEPLVRGDFLELVDAITEQGIRISQIYTNGMLVDAALLDDLTKRGIRPTFVLSFDGVGWHDWLRGTEGAEKMATDAIRLLRGRDFPVFVESTFHRDSIGSLYETMTLLAELGVDHWKAATVTDSGNWLGEDGSFDLSPEELYTAWLELIPRYLEEGAPLCMMLGGFFKCDKGSKEYTIPMKKRGDESDPLCLTARSTMYIAADGKLLPCMPLAGLPFQEDMPSLNDMTIAQALSDSRYLERIKTPVSALMEHKPECASCEHRKVCGGGCRAMALSFNKDNDYLGVDPSVCAFFKGGWEDRIHRAAKRYSVKLVAEIRELSKEISEEELKAVAGGHTFGPPL
jgi:radical SAM protein with 4Fe4S-binding SPASM domain